MALRFDMSTKEKKAILGDLMRRFPRGARGKLRHYHYRTKVENSWGNAERLVDPQLDLAHPKLPAQDDHSFLGHPMDQLWRINDGEWEIRQDMRSLFPELTQRQVTTRTRRVQRRLSKSHRRIRREGAPGIYRVTEGYGQVYQSYLYASSLEEAKQLAEMFLLPAMNPTDRRSGAILGDVSVNVQFETFSGPENIGEWNEKSREFANKAVSDLTVKIEKLQAKIESINTFQVSAELVVASISAGVAAQNLQDLD